MVSRFKRFYDKLSADEKKARRQKYRDTERRKVTRYNQQLATGDAILVVNKAYTTVLKLMRLDMRETVLQDTLTGGDIYMDTVSFCHDYKMYKGDLVSFSPGNPPVPSRRKPAAKAKRKSLSAPASKTPLNSSLKISKVSEKKLTQLAQLYKLLGTRDRIFILASLSETDLTVTQLMKLLNISQSAMSQHLGKMRAAGLVSVAVRGTERLYSLKDESIRTMINLAIEL